MVMSLDRMLKVSVLRSMMTTEESIKFFMMFLSRPEIKSAKKLCSIIINVEM